MTKGFRRGFALFGVLALAVWLAATVWLHRGWRAMDCQLIDQGGDAAALRGLLTGDTVLPVVEWRRVGRALAALEQEDAGGE